MLSAFFARTSVQRGHTWHLKKPMISRRHPRRQKPSGEEVLPDSQRLVYGKQLNSGFGDVIQDDIAVIGEVLAFSPSGDAAALRIIRQSVEVVMKVSK